MGVGHVVDGNTFALWRFDETTHQDYADAADETGNYDASQSTDTQKPTIVGGPGGAGDYARWFQPELSKNLQFTPDASLATVLTGDWTIEAWIYIEDLSAARTIINVGGSGETTATNYLVWWTVQTSGFQDVFWEHGSGTNANITQSTGTTISVRTWTYVAITSSVDAGNRTVNFFVDSGTSQDNGTDTNADGGTSADGYIGTERDLTDDFHGGIGRIRISNTVRTSTELNNNATSTTKTFANDANTTALWDFQEPPEIEDVSGNGWHLASSDFSTNQPRISDSLLFTDGGQSRFIAYTGQYYILYQQEAVRTLLLGEYTLEWWGVMNTDTSATRGLLEWGGSGESEAGNYLIGLYFSVSANLYRGAVFWEYSTGVNVDSTGTSTIVSNFAEGAQDAQKRHHYAVVFQSAGGGMRNVLFYRDATLIETLGPFNDPTGGTATSSASDYGLRVLQYTGSGLWRGFADDMRLSDKARTLSEIQASYNRGIQTFSRSIPALPRQEPV